MTAGTVRRATATLDGGIQSMQYRIDDLAAWVGSLQGQFSVGVPQSAFAEIMRLTEEMFSAPDVCVDSDPEDSERSFIVLTVRAEGDPSEIVSKRIEWHEKVATLHHFSPGILRLSIVPN